MRYRDVPGSLGVLKSPDNFMPTGQVDCKRQGDNGLAVFRLRVKGQGIAEE